MKKEKKKFKKWMIALIASVVVIVLLAGGGALFLFWGNIFRKAQNSDLGAYYGYFGHAPETEGNNASYIDYSEKMLLFQDEIEAGMEEDATDEEKVLAAYIVYRIASLADATAGQKAKYTVGSGAASGSISFQDNPEPISVSGEMNLTATYYMLKWPFTPFPTLDNVYDENTYKTYEVSEEYTQIPAGGVSSDQDALVKIGESILPLILAFAKKKIITPEYEITYNGDSTSSIITSEGVTAKFKDRKRDYVKVSKEEEQSARDFEKVYPEDWGDEYGDSAKDLSIHQINMNTIIPSSVEIEKKIGTSVTGKKINYYSVKFDVDTLSNRGTEDSATYYAEKLYIYHAPKAFTDYLSNYRLYYSKLSVEMTVFENGYIRTWGTDEVWEMTGDIELGKMAITAGITSQNKSAEAFCYDYDTIMQGFSNRYFGESEYVGLPRENLPFYSELKEYSPEEYGTYR